MKESTGFFLYDAQNGLGQDVNTWLISAVLGGVIRIALLYWMWWYWSAANEPSSMLAVAIILYLLLREQIIAVVNWGLVKRGKRVVFHDFRYAHQPGEKISSAFVLLVIGTIILVPPLKEFPVLIVIASLPTDLTGMRVSASDMVLIFYSVLYFLLKIGVRDIYTTASFLRRWIVRRFVGDLQYDPYRNLPDRSQLKKAFGRVFLFTPSVIIVGLCLILWPSLRQELSAFPMSCCFALYILTRQNISDAFSLAYWWSDYKVTPLEETSPK